MKAHKVMSIDFQHSNPGCFFASEEEFKQDCISSLQELLKKRIEFMEGVEITDDNLPPLPMLINVYFENGSYAATMLHPESDTDKQYLMTGVKKMLAKYNVAKKIKSVMLMMEAWVGEIDTKERKKNDPFIAEMSEEQLQRRISREWKENKIKKATRIVCEYQTPIILDNKQHTNVSTSVYKLFEHKILLPDEAMTKKMSYNTNSKDHNRKPWFSMFTEFAEDDTINNKDVLNFNVFTAAEFLKKLNKLM